MTTEAKLKLATETLKYYAKMEADLRKQYGHMAVTILGKTNKADEALKTIGVPV